MFVAVAGHSLWHCQWFSTGVASGSKGAFRVWRHRSLEISAVAGVDWWNILMKDDDEVLCMHKGKQETQCDVRVRVWSVEEKRDDANRFFFFGFMFSVYVSLPPELLFPYTEAAECLENKYVRTCLSCHKNFPASSKGPWKWRSRFRPWKGVLCPCNSPAFAHSFAERFMGTGFQRPHGTTSFQPTKWVCTCSFGGTGYWQSSGLPQQSQVRCTIKRESQTWWKFKTRPCSKAIIFPEN